MQYQKLFDEAFIKRLPPLDKFSNPMIVALCRRGELEAFRAQIERWFQNLPEDQKADMYSRLRSLDDHLSAFYELVFHQYFLEEGWKVQKHPVVNGQKPDFFIEMPSNHASFFLEVTTILGKEKLQRERFNTLLRKINAINTEFLVIVGLGKWLAEDVEYDSIVQRVESWLLTLEKKEKAHYTMELCDWGFNGSITAWFHLDVRPKSGCISGWSPPVRSADPAIKLVKAAISEKVKKYKFIKNSGLPFVIAICSSGNFLLDSFAMESALYGHIVVSWDTNNPQAETKVLRDNSGLITPNPGLLGQPRNTRVSAVIFCTTRWNEGRMLYDMRVFHNPLAITKLPSQVFAKMPQLTEIESDEPDYITLGWQNDNKQCIIFE